MRTSWQTLLADLSLVLFMITTGALARAQLQLRTARSAPPAHRSDEHGAATSASAQSPLAIYHDSPGAPPLATWLAQQPSDARQQITIVARYRPGSERTLPQRLAGLLAVANEAGAHPRIVVEPGSGETSAGVGFDAPEGAMAQDLLRAHSEPHRGLPPHDQQDRTTP